MDDAATLLQHLTGPDQDDMTRAFALWLSQAADPDDWHRVAIGWNWDQGEDVLTWISLQPQCDQATALLIFWRGQPDYFVQFRGDRAAVPPVNLDLLDFVAAIRARWLAGHYRRAEIMFDTTNFDDRAPVDFDQLKRAHPGQPAIDLPASMRVSLPGKRLTDEGYIEGIPVRFWPKELQ